MITSILLLATFAAPVLVVSAIAWSKPIRLHERLAASEWATRLARGNQALIAELGPVATAIGLLLAGSAAIVGICWPLGRLAKVLEDPIDVPTFEWMQSQMSPTSATTSTLTQLTKMGDVDIIAILASAAAVFFAVLWRRRQWWFPPVVLILTVAAELVLQRALALVVDRGHPPTSIGSYPSGGTARIIAVVGVVYFLTLVTWPRIHNRRRAVGWTAIGLLGATEAYTRFYLLRHWTTDLVGGWILGQLLLAVILVSVWPITKIGAKPIRRVRDPTLGNTAEMPADK